MVKAAYESGHPSIGVGAGNTPAVIDETADIAMAVSSILISKTFDNGVICASEQNIVAHEAVSGSRPWCLLLPATLHRMPATLHPMHMLRGFVVASGIFLKHWFSKLRVFPSWHVTGV
jgi:gamma-glutamyl phosphate reductase